jgi:hypothetical protein
VDAGWGAVVVSPEDERHGTNRGYVVGCRDECCTKAHRRYMKLYRMGRQPRMVDATGTQRRIEALLALGWTCKDIGGWCDRGDEWARMVSRSARVTTTTALVVAQAFDRWCMTIPTGLYHERNRRHAARKGYAPPLAWDDIDNPDEKPRGIPTPTRKEPAELMVEDWDLLRRNGYSRRQAAERMGITKKRLEKAIERVGRRMQEAS